MLLNITLSIFVLILINLLLIRFICLKTTKPKNKTNKKVIKLKSEVTMKRVSENLAPTGS